MERVNEMIEKAKDYNSEMLPLCRLCVELSEGYEKIPPQRFGAEFVGRVANPEELLLYSKRSISRDVGLLSEMLFFSSQEFIVM